jgi:hypothetical protein
MASSGLLGVSALARELGVGKGTVSKQAAAGKIPVAERDTQGNPLFDLAAVKAARGDNLNPLMRRQPMTAGDADQDSSAAPDGAAPAERRSPDRAPSGLVQQQQLEKQLKNRRLLRQIAVDEGLVVLRSVVDDDQTTFARRTRDGVTGQMADKASALYAFVGERPRTEAEFRVWLDEHTGQAFDEVSRLIAAEDEDEFGDAEPGQSDPESDQFESGEPDAEAAP